MTKRLNTIALFVLLAVQHTLVFAGSDWPMWRYDFNRSASSPEQLAENLYLQWQVNYPDRTPVWDDPLNRDLMKYDQIFEPIVAENKLFIGFNDQDKVIALDLNSGKEIWHYYADGPVRLPLASNKGKIYFTGDDGYCYCVNANNGSLVWKRLLAPSKIKLLGNKRLISMWPARGGIVIKDDLLYTAASIFPLMGTFIYALDASTGDIVWKNEGTGSNYILQPHKSPAFADVAPQGAFTISDDKLLVAGGRSVPAAFDLKTGEELYYKLAESGKTGGAFTCSNDQVFFNHHRNRNTVMYDSDNGEKIASVGEYPVIDGNLVYFSGKNISAAKIDPNKKLINVWNSEISATNELIKAGDYLFAADSLGIKTVKLNSGNQPKVIWEYKTSENIERLLAANGKLIAVSSEGNIMVFGDTPVNKVTEYNKTKTKTATTKGHVKKIIKEIEIKDGYGLVFGGGKIKQLNGLLSSTALQITVYEKDTNRLRFLQEYFDKAGITANRINFHLYEENFPLLPKYFSSLTIINDISYLANGDQDVLSQLYESTRPYDGKIILTFKDKERKHILKAVKDLNFSGANIDIEKSYSIITRAGSLKGSSPWTHNYGNIANTVKSDDQLVKAPLGVLWFGGNSNMDVLPRHGHGPGEQVIDGRLIIQGVNSLSARDVYTGRVLWKREFEKLKDDSWNVFYDKTYDEENPLDTKYNQVHLPGANARGTNFIATKEFVYLIEGNICKLIDIKTGEISSTFSTGDQATQELGYIGVYDDLLILGNNFSDFSSQNKDTVKVRKPEFHNYNITASEELIIMNRFSGKRLWDIKANHGFIHNSVIAGDGVLYCLDKLPQNLETKLKRRGEAQPEGSRLLYLDAKTGKVQREVTKDIFGTWLGYSSEHKLLLQATRPSRDMLNGETGDRMITYNVLTGEKIWDKPLLYQNPPIIHNDKIYNNGNGFHLLSGEPLMEKDPLTGEEVRWNFKREYGCGIVAASEHMLTFRSASAGFVNLDAFEGTGSLGGWKASCSTNLIPADGVLNSPDYTRTCQCAYQNQTSLALVNMPWMSYWTNSNYKWNGKTIQQLGLNFGAPGDRSDDNKVLWFEYPFVGGVSPEIPIKIDTLNFKRIRKEPISILSKKTPWISASALEGIKSLEITLSKDSIVKEASYTIRLYFSELENKKAEERVFDIAIQGEKRTENFDIVKEAGKTEKEIIKQYQGIKAGKTIKVDLIQHIGNPLISGIEIIQETASVQ